MLTGLQSSHEMLQTANESKRRFIRYIFHEVRVPFNAIVLGVEQLREDLYTEPLRPTEEMQDVVNILNEQSKVVARILNDVLSLQKIEDGALVLERQPFNMLEMVIGTLRSFQPLFAEKNLILVTEMESIEQAIKRVITHPHSHRLSPETDKGDDTNSLAIPPSMSPMDPKHDHTLITVAPSDPLPASPSAPLLATVTSATNGFNSTPTTSEASPATTDTSSASPIRANDLAPLTTIISPPNSSPDEYYSNAYEDSKELQRFAAVCSREVIGDRYRLRQVLANFLSNAVKFSSYSGIVKVRVKCSFDEDEIQPIYMNMNSSTITPLISAHTLNSSSNTTGSQPVETDADGKPIHNSMKVEDIATPIDQQPHTSSPIDVPSTSPIPLPPLSSSSSSSTSSISSSYCPARVRIRVEVEDTGRGLSSSELKQMFKPYVQFKSGEQQQGKGTGLGLNISQSLIHLHGGEIGVTSDGIPGRGCNFWFELPLDILPINLARMSKPNTPQQGTVPIARMTRDGSITSASHSMSSSTHSQTHTLAGAGTTTSAAALAAAAAFPLHPDSNSAGPNGLRSWHSPRTPMRGGGGNGVSHHGSRSLHSSPKPSPSIIRRVASQSDRRQHGNGAGLDENGNYVELIPDRPVRDPYHATGLGPHSSPNTPLLARGSLRPHGAHSARKASIDSGLSPASNGAAFTSIVPTGNDVHSNLQYMSQLTFLNELALQGQGGNNHSKVSPLQQYRSTILSQSLPYGVGYSARTLPPATSLASTSDVPESQYSAVDNSDGVKLNKSNSNTPLLHTRTVHHQPRPAVTPASSPLPPPLNSTLHPPVLSSPSQSASSSLDPNIDQNVVFSTSPFNNMDLRYIDPLASPQSSFDVPRHPRPLHRSHSRAPSGDILYLPPSPMLHTSSHVMLNGVSTGSIPFIPTLPVVTASPPQPSVSITEADPSASPVATPSASTQPKHRVLVVEDSVPNRKLLMMLLRALKCDTVGVENGLLAVEAFDPSIQTVDQVEHLLRHTSSASRSSPPPTEIDLVLIDGNMPVLDGVRATRAIRSLGVTVPIVAVTGNALDEDTERFIRAGANEVLSKPVQRAALEKILQTFLTGFQVPASVAQQKINELKQGR